jgi:hypothetical protein
MAASLSAIDPPAAYPRSASYTRHSNMATCLYAFSHATCLGQHCPQPPVGPQPRVVLWRARCRALGPQFTSEAFPEFLASSDSPTWIRPRQVVIGESPPGRPSLRVPSSPWRGRKQKRHESAMHLRAKDAESTRFDASLQTRRVCVKGMLFGMSRCLRSG